MEEVGRTVNDGEAAFCCGKDRLQNRNLEKSLRKTTTHGRKPDLGVENSLAVGASGESYQGTNRVTRYSWLVKGKWFVERIKREPGAKGDVVENCEAAEVRSELDSGLKSKSGPKDTRL